MSLGAEVTTMRYRGRRGSRKGFDSLGAVLEEAIRGLGLGDMIAKGTALHLWPEVVGETVARVTYAETVQGTTLIVNVADSAWLNELRYMEESMVEGLNEAVGKPVIEGVFFKLGSLGPSGPEDEEPGPPAFLEPEAAAHLEEVLKGIEDPELRSTLRQILAASRRVKEEPEQ